MTRNAVLIQKRKESGLTQSQLARQCGISRPFYANIERGYRVPHLGLAFRIATLLRTDIHVLFGDMAEPAQIHSDKDADSDCL